MPYIPDGQWLCRKCTVSPDRPVTCVLCPAEAGAFKQTTQGAWAHLLCAIWIPETGVANTIYMEPVDGVEMIPKQRWRLVCYLCKRRVGACIQCSNRSCYTAFHVTCARDYGLHLKLKVRHENGEIVHENKAFCHKHGPDGPMPTAAHPAFAEDDFEDGGVGSVAPPAVSAAASTSSRQSLSRKGAGGSSAASAVAKAPGEGIPERIRGGPLTKLGGTPKSSRAYSSGFKAGPPVVPEYMFAKVRRKSVFLSLVCRYWSLKREARRGAPILKRLHLEVRRRRWADGADLSSPGRRRTRIGASRTSRRRRSFRCVASSAEFD